MSINSKRYTKTHQYRYIPVSEKNNMPSGMILITLVSDPYFSVFLFIFLLAFSKHLHDVLIIGRPIHKWIKEQRIWMKKNQLC